MARAYNQITNAVLYVQYCSLSRAEPYNIPFEQRVRKCRRHHNHNNHFTATYLSLCGPPLFGCAQSFQRKLNSLLVLCVSFHSFSFPLQYFIQDTQPNNGRDKLLCIIQMYVSPPPLTTKCVTLADCC